MIFGMMTGWLLRGTLTPNQKTVRMIWTGAVCLVLGLALDPRLLSSSIPLDWTLCPIVKRIWTPSWTLFSTGWTLWMLAAFYWVIDVKGWKAWAFPFAIVGMNSIAIYVGYQLLRPWISRTLKTHFSSGLFDFMNPFLAKLGIFRPEVQPIIDSVTALIVLWLMCYWMYRRKIFIRI